MSDWTVPAAMPLDRVGVYTLARLAFLEHPNARIRARRVADDVVEVAVALDPRPQTREGRPLPPLDAAWGTKVYVDRATRLQRPQEVLWALQDLADNWKATAGLALAFHEANLDMRWGNARAPSEVARDARAAGIHAPDWEEYLAWELDHPAPDPYSTASSYPDHPGRVMIRECQRQGVPVTVSAAALRDAAAERRLPIRAAWA